MAIGSVELNGYMSRVQDYTTQKHNEQQKPLVDQGNFENAFKKEVNENVKKVHDMEEGRNQQKKFDAKEKGNGQYFKNNDMKKEKKSKNEHNKDGIVKPKTQGFDLKV
ncbi:MAG: hypothetical protein ACRC7V_03890 [Lachnospiraceae bacterium]